MSRVGKGGHGQPEVTQGEVVVIMVLLACLLVISLGAIGWGLAYMLLS